MRTDLRWCVPTFGSRKSDSYGGSAGTQGPIKSPLHDPFVPAGIFGSVGIRSYISGRCWRSGKLLHCIVLSRESNHNTVVTFAESFRKTCRFSFAVTIRNSFQSRRIDRNPRWVVNRSAVSDGRKNVQVCMLWFPGQSSWKVLAAVCPVCGKPFWPYLGFMKPWLWPHQGGPVIQKWVWSPGKDLWVILPSLAEMNVLRSKIGRTGATYPVAHVHFYELSLQFLRFTRYCRIWLLPQIPQNILVAKSFLWHYRSTFEKPLFFTVSIIDKTRGRKTWFLISKASSSFIDNHNRPFSRHVTEISGRTVRILMRGFVRAHCKRSYMGFTAVINLPVP